MVLGTYFNDAALHVHVFVLKEVLLNVFDFVLKLGDFRLDYFVNDCGSSGTEVLVRRCLQTLILAFALITNAYVLSRGVIQDLENIVFSIKNNN